jgi:tagaturonate reductase
VLLFGTGMLLRALVANAIDDANRRGVFPGGVVALQNTPLGHARDLAVQDGLFTLVERGFGNGAPLERTRLIGSITRALVAADEWEQVRALMTSPALRVIVSNVTEAGFRPDARDERQSPALASFPAKLADLLHARFQHLPSGPPLFVIPTELVPDNGLRLRAMVDEVCVRGTFGDDFRAWTAENVHFCSSLVDRITTGKPAPDDSAAIAERLGYTDALVTVTEPSALWAVEGDAAALHEAFPVDDGQRVVFSPDIMFYRERKVRLLNGAHTALAPLAVLAGVATVREATEHPVLGPFFHHLLFQEIVPGSGVSRDQAEPFARDVWNRFRNPWLEHSWSVIATNQDEKMRIRVVPSLVGFCRRQQQVPQGLALALAAHLRFVAAPLATLGDQPRWGERLDVIPGMLDAVSRWFVAIGDDGALAAVDTFLHATTKAGAGAR